MQVGVISKIIIAFIEEKTRLMNAAISPQVVQQELVKANTIRVTGSKT